MREAAIQSGIVKKLKALNIFVIKMHLMYITGVPDLLLLMPNGRVLWLEVKRPGEELRPKQVWFHRLLTKLGHHVATVTSYPEALLALQLFYKKTGEKHAKGFKEECKEIFNKEKINSKKACKEESS